MKIAFLIRSLNFGGAEKQLLLLASGLQEAGHEVSVHVFYPDGELEPEFRRRSIPVKIIGKSGRWDSLGFFSRVSASLRMENADIVHAFMGGANIVTALIKRFLRPAKVVWGIRNSRVDFNDYDWLVRLCSRVEGRLANSADLIICNSKAGQALAAERCFPMDRTVVVPNAIDTREFSINLGLRKTFRERLGISGNEILVGRVGRLDPVKDYPGFLRAAALASERNPRLRFACIGSGPEAYRDHLQRLAKDLKIGSRAVWTGGIAQMCEAYNGLDLLVSSSVSEGFPNVLLEAMACGRTCVTTDAGDSAEIVGKHGLVVPPGREDILADAILRAIEAQPPPEVIRAQVAQQFSVSRLVERTESNLNLLLRNCSVRTESRVSHLTGINK